MSLKPYIFITDYPENNGRRFAIPDIHGCYYTFQALIKKLSLTTDDHVFILGDMINRGKRSSYVIDFILHLYSSGYKIFPLQGNHENDVIKNLIDNPISEELLQHKKTLKSFTKDGIILPSYDVFFRTLPHCILSGDDYVLAHAGLNFEGNPFKDFDEMLSIREFSYDGSKIKNRKLIHGHTPVNKSEIKENLSNNAPVINLDNGCVVLDKHPKKGTLLCLNLDSQELIGQRNID